MSTEVTCDTQDSSLIFAPCIKLWEGQSWLSHTFGTNRALLSKSVGEQWNMNQEVLVQLYQNSLAL